MPKISLPEEHLSASLTNSDLTNYEREYKFYPGRRFRFDFAFITEKLAIECEGGTWSRGITRHSSGAGMASDCEKYNLATLDGWRVLRFTSDMVFDGRALATIKQALEGTTE